MRQVIYYMMVSLDGFVEGPNRNLDWAMPDEELHSFVNEQAREMGAFLYGRRLYEIMAAYWPTADLNPEASAVEVEFARIWREKPKIVFSTTLDSVGWNSRLVRDNIAEEITTLKQQPGEDVELGGPTIAAAVARLGLIDEYRLLVHPVILGGGTPFFPAGINRTKLRLLDSRTFDSGVIYLRYRNEATVA